MGEFNLSSAIASEEKAETPINSLERAIQMGEAMALIDDKLRQLDDEFKAAKTQFNTIALDQLPQLLEELGLESIKLKGGATIEVKGDLSTSITKAKHADAMSWLAEHNFGGIIKTAVTVSFGADLHDEAAEFAAEINEEFDEVAFKKVVHPATLKAFIKEQLAAGYAVPLELFSVHEYSIAKLTQPRG